MAVNDLTLFGSRNDRNASLRWNKVNEYPITQFEIIKSYDGNRFSITDVLNVLPEEKTFDWTDYNTENINTYYQIVGKTNGVICCSSNVIILKPNTEENNSIALYPNPAQDQLNIQFFVDQNDLLQIEIVDIQGRIIQSDKKDIVDGWNNWSIQLNNQTNGLYFLRMKTENGYILKKFLVQ